MKLKNKEWINGINSGCACYLKAMVTGVEPSVIDEQANIEAKGFLSDFFKYCDNLGMSALSALRVKGISVEKVDVSYSLGDCYGLTNLPKWERGVCICVINGDKYYVANFTVEVEKEKLPISYCVVDEFCQEHKYFEKLNEAVAEMYNIGGVLKCGDKFICEADDRLSKSEIVYIIESNVKIR